MPERACARNIFHLTQLSTFETSVTYWNENIYIFCKMFQNLTS
ncbi:hypothetical protein CLOSTASPAR_01575 [[Clostridium] asparagiforme DSM 15981]|uniref:Uncharacterized protein n=1 Tax=[Clostridium] asparagiforme DSM 15981 TaxID=518636 RepID=C0CX54_9FIRM|nr:hypothetical protein CLOSTASPAR_01575 [[Clostridium] asparagiforme DSM 15981]